MFLRYIFLNDIYFQIRLKNYAAVAETEKSDKISALIGAATMNIHTTWLGKHLPTSSLVGVVVIYSLGKWEFVKRLLEVAFMTTHERSAFNNNVSFIREASLITMPFLFVLLVQKQTHMYTDLFYYGRHHYMPSHGII